MSADHRLELAVPESVQTAITTVAAYEILNSLSLPELTSASPPEAIVAPRTPFRAPMTVGLLNHP